MAAAPVQPTGEAPARLDAERAHADRVRTAAPPAPAEHTAPVDGSSPHLEAGADLRRDLSAAAGFPLVVTPVAGEAARRFAARHDLATVSQVGPATPDHVLRTKRVPLLGRDVAGYVRGLRGLRRAPPRPARRPGARRPSTRRRGS